MQTLNTETPGAMLDWYKAKGIWDRAGYFYDTWRKTTTMIDPPAEWPLLDPRMQVAICAVANLVEQDTAGESWES